MSVLTFSHSIPPSSPSAPQRTQRPSFSSRKTSDRLEENSRRPSTSVVTKKPSKPRRSAFKEEGLDDLSTSVHSVPVPESQEKLEDILTQERQLSRKRQGRSLEGVDEREDDGDSINGSLRSEGSEKENTRENRQGHKKSGSATWRFGFGQRKRPMIKSSATAPPGSFSSLPRVAMLVFLVAIVVPGFKYTTNVDSGKGQVVMSGADAGVIGRKPELVENASTIAGRADSPTDVCTRWAHQSANVNGTVYIYGGQAKTASGQTTNTWNNNLLSLDLTKTWEISTPVLSGLPQPSGPPAVALGALWHSKTSLFVYGGEFSDNPSESPLPVSTWEYNIGSSSWLEHGALQSAAGNNSDGGNQPIQRSAEGASLSVPSLGRSWYFGGHLDMYTTPGWSNQIARVYLKSLLEFTHPGYANSGVESLGTKTAAGADGVYRNITEGGLQDEAKFTERADGVLVYVPGWGVEGIMLGLAGGTNQSFTEMNIIDIYDIANSTWYKQATSGPSPPIRVNPCAVVAAAPDGTSFNIYLYGGQNLIPFGSQIQYSDMWILTIPSFTWIQVDLSGQSQPPARAGHTCHLWDAQMVVIGGYVGTDISCDSPGVYVFNASSLSWQNSFTALSSSAGTDGDGGDGGDEVIQGSTGYQVPAIVQSIIGGSSEGGATATQPAAGSASVGPIATGRPPTFTITQSVSGSTVTQTSSPQPGQPTSSPAKKQKNKGAIIAGVIAGLLFLLAAYLAFCTWLYRRQLGVYKNHVAMAQRTAFTHGHSPQNSSDLGRQGEKPGAGAFLGPFGTDISQSQSRPSNGASSDEGVTPNSGVTSGQQSSRYGRLSDVDGVVAFGGSSAGMEGKRSEDMGYESGDDLLGGQEPSFFSVVLNPRRTLRVVNND